MIRKYNIDYKDVKKFYIEQGFTYQEIALKYGCSSGYIRKIAKRHKIISIRGKSKYRKILIQKSDIPLSIKETDIFDKINVPFSDQALELIMGSLLGDAYIKRRKNKYNFTYNIYFAHCESQKEYVYWKKSFFKEYSNEVRIEKRHESSSSFENSQDLYVFSTKPYDLEFIYNLLDMQNKKTLSDAFLKYLTPLSLAIWYQDDGSFNVQNRVIRMATMCFTKNENLILKKYFYDKLRMPCFLEKVNCGSGYSLVLTQNSSKKFLRLIEPYKFKYFDYKFIIINNPSETSKADKTVSREGFNQNPNIAKHPNKDDGIVQSEMKISG